MGNPIKWFKKQLEIQKLENEIVKTYKKIWSLDMPMESLHYILRRDEMEKKIKLLDRKLKIRRII